MRRIERLINLIAALLEARQPMTAEDIRQRIAGYDQPSFEAFRRAFERDKEALRAMGIPLELRSTDPLGDRSDGYLIPKSRYYLPALDLEPDELAALKIAAQAVLGAGEEAGAGWLKLSIGDPSGNFESGRVTWGADVAAEQPVLGPLYAALLERRPIRFRYESREGEVTERTVEPYGLVHRRGNWYLVGRDAAKDEPRTFRASRVLAPVEPVNSNYEIPASFDASALVARRPWEAGDEVVKAVVRFDSSMRWWAEQNMPDHLVGNAPEGAVDLEVSVANTDAFLSWIIELGGAAQILSPARLREQLLERLNPFLEPLPAREDGKEAKGK